MNKILIADDEQDILTMLKKYFEMKDFLVITAKDGEEALEKISQSPDIILLDINMPNLTGFEVMEKIRAHITCPILFLTAKEEDGDKIKGFSLGADDYVVKPFSILELGARVDAHLRRQKRENTQKEVVFRGDLIIDFTNHRVSHRGEEINFVKKEIQIIEFLASHPNQIFSKERIYESVWDYDKDGDAQVIAEHIRRIRAKFANHCQENYVETVWGLGYKWIN